MTATIEAPATTPKTAKRVRCVVVSSINGTVAVTVNHRREAVENTVIYGKSLSFIDVPDDVHNFPLDSDGLIEAYTLAETIAARAQVTMRSDIAVCREGCDGSELRKWAESYVECGEDVAVAGAAADYYADNGEAAKETFFRALISPVKIGRKQLVVTMSNEYENIGIRYVSANARNQWKDYARRSNVEAAIAYVARLLSEQDASDAKKRKEKEDAVAAKATWANPYSMGQILYRSFGYDETHYTFYQIVGMPTPKTLLVRCITRREAGGGRGTYWTMEPVKDSFAEDATETARIIVTHKRGQTYTSVTIDGEHYQTHTEGRTYYETY